MPSLEKLLEEMDESDESAFADLVARLDKALQEQDQLTSSASASVALRGSDSNRQKGMPRVHAR